MPLEWRPPTRYPGAGALMALGTTEASGKGFREVAGYVFGKNRPATQMAMTAPVRMSSDPRGGVPSTTRVSFVLEKSYSRRTAPAPLRGVRLDLNAGIYDGTRENAPVTPRHSLLLYNALAPTAEQRLSAATVQELNVLQDNGDGTERVEAKIASGAGARKFVRVRVTMQ